MGVRSKTRRLLGTAALCCVTATSAGCTGAALFGLGDDEPEDLELGSEEILDGNALAVYVEMMRQLVDGDPVARAEVFLDVAESAAEAPTTTNRLKLALALATPGHPAADAADARRMLSDLLATGSALLPEERMLVTVQLEEVEQRLRLSADAEQLRTEVEETRAELESQNGRRLEAALAENERLREELEEAQQKLDAITNIERSIRERDNGSDSQ